MMADIKVLVCPLVCSTGSDTLTASVLSMLFNHLEINLLPMLNSIKQKICELTGNLDQLVYFFYKGVLNKISFS